MNPPSLLTILILLWGNAVLFAQDETECSFPISKKARKSYEDAYTYYEKKQFGSSAKSLESAIEISPNFAEAYFLLGLLHFRQNTVPSFEKAKDAFDTYITLIPFDCPKQKHNAYLYLGDICYQLDHWKESAKYLGIFLSDVDKIKTDRDYEKAENLHKWATFLDQIYTHPVPFEPEIVPHIPSQDDEYLARLSPDDEILFYTRRITLPSQTERLYSETFCFANRQSDGTYSNEGNMPEPFNKGRNEGGASVSLDRKHLYYTICQKQNGYQNCDIYCSTWDGKNWSEALLLPNSINSPQYWESQACISPDGNTLYFVSDRNDGFGGYDIWISKKDSNDRWTKARNAGDKINTPGNERTPFLHPDGNTLYFSSDSRLGMGGYDIFYLKLDDKKLKEPTNIGYPINSEADESGFFVDLEGIYGYFSSTRWNDKGGWNIYRFKLYPEARPQEVALLKGLVLENSNDSTNGNKKSSGKVRIRQLDGKRTIEVPIDSTDGYYRSIVDRNTDILISYSDSNTAFEAQIVHIGGKDSNGKTPITEVHLQAKRLKIGEIYPIDALYFETNSFNLSTASIIVLTQFSDYLKEHPSMEIEIQGYTDDVGSDAYNLELSENRAKAVYDFLLSQDNFKNLVSYKGYGKGKYQSLSNKERALYRKTVFLIKAL